MIARVLLCLLAIVLWTQAHAQPAKPPSQLNTQTVADANATITSNITNVITSVALTATRTLTLPAANTVCKGCTITITDLAGSIQTPGNNIIVDGSGSDTINGRPIATLTCPYGTYVITSNNSNGWAITGQACDVPNAANNTAINQFGVQQGPMALLKLSPMPTGIPGAGVGWIMLTKGTNPGTCKVCVQVGLSGSVTCPAQWDNLPGGGVSQGGC